MDWNPYWRIQKLQNHLVTLKLDRILISRIDAIGDVTLTLPMCGYIKSLFPQSTIFFLGRSYTQAVIEACSAIDHFIDHNKLSALSEAEQITRIQSFSLDTVIHVFPNKQLSLLFKKAGVPFRIGTTNRWFHWFSCNKLVRLSRKKSNLHEAELNLRLLGAIGITNFPHLNSFQNYYHFNRFVHLPNKLFDLLSPNKFNLVLHPKSHGSGKEWPLGAYQELIQILPKEKFCIFISGSKNEQPALASWIKTLNADVIDISGLMNLAELISFFHQADGLVASSTGPLHLAAASGINALGLYPNTRPLHAGRWAPIGKSADYIESEDSGLDTISAYQVFQKIKDWSKN